MENTVLFDEVAGCHVVLQIVATTHPVHWTNLLTNCFHYIRECSTRKFIRH